MKRKFSLLLTGLLLTTLVSPVAGQSVNLLGIDHVALNVANLSTSAKWYEDRFGFRVLHQWKSTWMIGKDNIKIGLFLREKATPIDDPDNRKIIQHFAFGVDADKFQAIIDKFRAEGVQLGQVEDTGIAYSVFLKDPDGYEVEITTYHGDPKAPPK